MAWTGYTIVVLAEGLGKLNPNFAFRVPRVTAQGVFQQPKVCRIDGLDNHFGIRPTDDVELGGDKLVSEDVRSVPVVFGLENIQRFLFRVIHPSDSDLLNRPGFRVILPIAQGVGTHPMTSFEVLIIGRYIIAEGCQRL